MATEQDYRQLNEKIKKLDQERLVLQAQEQVKTEQREVLLKELSEVGVNIQDLAGEAIRLQAEIDADFSKVSARVDEFEKQLKLV